MDRLWAPWRAQYIRDSSGERDAEPGCFLCRGLAGSEDRENLLVWRGAHSVVVLNRFPYNNGHLLVAPSVPRWDGDTNFMPVLGNTKVIVESLFEFYDRFVEELSTEIDPPPGR